MVDSENEATTVHTHGSLHAELPIDAPDSWHRMIQASRLAVAGFIFLFLFGVFDLIDAGVITQSWFGGLSQAGSLNGAISREANFRLIPEAMYLLYLCFLGLGLNRLRSSNNPRRSRGFLALGIGYGVLQGMNFLITILITRTELSHITGTFPQWLYTLIITSQVCSLLSYAVFIPGFIWLGASSPKKAIRWSMASFVMTAAFTFIAYVIITTSIVISMVFPQANLQSWASTEEMYLNIAQGFQVIGAIFLVLGLTQGLRFPLALLIVVPSFIQWGQSLANIGTNSLAAVHQMLDPLIVLVGEGACLLTMLCLMYVIQKSALKTELPDGDDHMESDGPSPLHTSEREVHTTQNNDLTPAQGASS